MMATAVTAYRNFIELNIGYGLIPYFENEDEKIVFMEALANARRRNSFELGVYIPPIKINRDITLAHNAYSISVQGVEVSRWKLKLNKYLMLTNDGQAKDIKSEPTKEPLFGTPAFWINADEKPKAEKLGYLVADIPNIILAHLCKIMNEHAIKILTVDYVNELLLNLRLINPEIAEQLTSIISVPDLLKIFQNLLSEGIPIRKLEIIFRTIIKKANKTNDPDLLTEYIREALNREIINKYKDAEGKLTVIILSARLSYFLYLKLRQKKRLSKKVLHTIVTHIKEKQISVNNDTQLLLAVPPQIRRFVRDILRKYFDNLPVVSFNEISKRVRIRLLSEIDIDV